jgi:hypothetical protein
MSKADLRQKILPGNFEEMFDPQNFGGLLQESKELYGTNKVLREMHLAKISEEDIIPSEIKDIVRTLETLPYHSRLILWQLGHNIDNIIIH